MPPAHSALARLLPAPAACSLVPACVQPRLGRPALLNSSHPRLQAAAFLRDAALVVRHAASVRMGALEVRHTGGYAIWLAEGARDCAVHDSVLHELGAHGGG